MQRSVPIAAVAVAGIVLTHLIVFLAPLGTTVVAAVTALGLAGALWAAALRPRPTRAMLAAPLAFLAWGLVTAAWSLDAGETVGKAGQLAALLLALALLGGGACALPEAARGPVRRATLVSGAALIAVIALEGHLGRPYHSLVHALGWAASADPYVLNRATLMMVLLSWPAAQAAAALGRRRLALALPPLALAAAVGLDSGTAGMAAVAGVAAGGLALALRAAPAVLAAGFTAGAVVVVPLAAQFHEWLGDSTALPRSLLHRFFIWSFAGDRIAEQPLLGWGLGTARAMPNFGVTNLFVAPDADIIPLHTHNAYIQVMLETGLVGYALCVGFVAWLMLRTRRLPTAERACTLGALGALAGAWLTGYGVWQSWWLAGLVLLVFALTASRSEASVRLP